LIRLPPNISKNPKYREKSISEIIKMETPRKMSPATVEKYLSRVSALFEYARRNGLYEAANPATGMNPKKSRRAHEARAIAAGEEVPGFRR
jgi:site-specific recombinase XerD